MRKIITIMMCLTGLFFGACSTKPNAKAVKQEVLNIHDKLMLDGERVIKNRMKLDTLVSSEKMKSLPKSAIENVNDLISRLNKADESMMDWMHFFKDDFKGKNDQEDLDYYKSQMVKIREVEDRYIKVIKESDSVLKIYNIDPALVVETKDHK